jgi:hypothetical protein
MSIHRKCSFCQIYGHNIKNCHDIDLLEFKEKILTLRNLYIREPDIFLNYLKGFHIRLLWVLAVNECKILVRNHNKNECINAIYNKFMRYQSRLYELNHDRFPIDNELGEHINKIYQFYPQRQIDDQEEEQRMQVLLDLYNPNQNHNYNNPDYISDHDILSVSSSSSDEEEEEFDITWYIDRTGDFPTKLTITKTLDIQNTNTIQTLECGICYEEKVFENFIHLQCNHEFCHDCINRQIDTKKASCAFCREKMKHFIIRSQVVDDLISTKLF